MRHKKQIVALCFLAMLTGCNKGSGPCSDLDQSTQYMAHYLSQMAEVISHASSNEAAMTQLETNARADAEQIEQCAVAVTAAFRDMSTEAIMRHHEAFIQDQRVMRFLDAQDRLIESATPEQIERLDTIVAPFSLLSE